MIREFARDSVAPTPACNFVRNLMDGAIQSLWTYERYDEWYVERFLIHDFRLTYDHRTGLLHVKHLTIADEDKYMPRVKGMVLAHELFLGGMDPDSRAFEQAWVVRHKAWQKLVQGRTWTAVFADDWNMWPIEKIRANRDLDYLMDGLSVYKKKGETCDNIIDLSTLTLLPR
jgi:hypothetical protein